jgi:hypothetical protein
MMERTMIPAQKSGRPAQPRGDVLRTPTSDLRERGEYEGHVLKSSLYTKASLHPVLSAALLVGAGVAIGAMLRWSSGGRS